MQTTDVVVIGGGIIGCSIAYHLRKIGINVVVVEQGEIGSGASLAATGLLAPIRPFLSPDRSLMQLQLAGIQTLKSLVPELEVDSGISTEFTQTGTLRLNDLPQDHSLDNWIKRWNEIGYPIEMLTDDKLFTLEPGLSPIFHRAIYNSHEPQINAQKLIAAYVSVAKRLGALFLSHQPVQGFIYQGNKVMGVHTLKGDIVCDRLVIAAGAWSGLCMQWLNMHIPVRPLKGQSILLPQSPLPIRHILFHEGMYIAPKSNGTIIVGATQEDTGFDDSIDAGSTSKLVDFAYRLIPSLSSCPVRRIVTGLRPSTTDHNPIIGVVPNWNNVTLATGHGGFGILLSAITGQSIADLIVTGKTSQIIRTFAPDRFSSSFIYAA